MTKMRALLVFALLTFSLEAMAADGSHASTWVKFYPIFSGLLGVVALLAKRKSLFGAFSHTGWGQFLTTVIVGAAGSVIPLLDSGSFQWPDSLITACSAGIAAFLAQATEGGGTFGEPGGKQSSAAWASAATASVAAERTLVYDVDLGEWHERAWMNPGTGELRRWRGTHATFGHGRMLIGDSNGNAVYQLSGGIPPGFSPAGIVPADQVIHPGDDFLIAGFGHTSTSSSGKTGVLHRTTLEVEKPDYSKTEYSFTQKTSGACFGDSGGPAYREIGGAWLLAGVTSRGSQNCVGFSVYTRVEKHGDWLTAAAERLRKTQ
jgi:hypothetical protein